MPQFVSVALSRILVHGPAKKECHLKYCACDDLTLKLSLSVCMYVCGYSLTINLIQCGPYLAVFMPETAGLGHLNLIQHALCV